jgi:hypothetical protein
MEFVRQSSHEELNCVNRYVDRARDARERILLRPDRASPVNDLNGHFPSRLRIPRQG